MISYKQLYFHLFRALGRATEALDQGRYLKARTLLIAAQREAEAACLETDFLPEEPLEREG